MNPWLSAFLNSFLFMVVGAALVYVGMSMIFSKRNSVVVFVSYFLFKGLLWSWYDASFVLDTLGPFERSFQMVGTPLLGAASYVVLYYTWRADFYKIGLGGFVLDVFASVAMMPVFLIADGPFPMAAPFDYRGYLGMGGLVRCLGFLVVDLLLLFVARPIFKWFGSYEFVHKNIWQGVVVGSIVAATLPRMITTMQIGRPTLIVFWFGVFLLVPLVCYLTSQARVKRKRRVLLESEIALIEEYGHTIRDQLDYLEKNAMKLDGAAAEVERVQNGVESEYLKERVECLKSLCNQLRYGSYSDDPALDVVLTSYEGEFAREGLRIGYRVLPLGDAAARAALLAQVILAWALDSCKSVSGNDGTHEEPKREAEGVDEDETDAEFRIIREGDQLVFVLDIPSNRRRRFSESILKERFPSYDGALVEVDDGNRKVVHVLALETQPGVSVSG